MAKTVKAGIEARAIQRTARQSPYKMRLVTDQIRGQRVNDALALLKFSKKHDAWKKEIGDWAIKNFSKAENLRTNYRQWNNTLNVDFDIVVKESDFPVEPEKDYETIHQHSYRELVQFFRDGGIDPWGEKSKELFLMVLLKMTYHLNW